MSVPEGKYVARAVRGDFPEVQEGKSPRVAVAFCILVGDYRDQEVYWYGSLAGGAIPFTIKALKTAGANLGGDELEITDLSGLGSVDVQIVLRDEEYDGKWRTKVAFINPLGGGITPMDPAKKLLLNEQMKGHLLAFNQKNRGTVSGASGAGKRPTTAPANNSQQGSDMDADIPF